MKTQTIFRNASPTGGFTTISNRLLQAKGVTIETRGFIATMMSYPTHWVFNSTWANDELGLGETKLKRIIREAKEAGFMKVERVRDPQTKQFSGPATHYFTDVPFQFAESGETPPMEEAISGKTRLVGNPIGGETTPHRKETSSYKGNTVEQISPVAALTGDESEYLLGIGFKGPTQNCVGEPEPSSGSPKKRAARGKAAEAHGGEDFQRFHDAYPKSGRHGIQKAAKYWLKLKDHEKEQRFASLTAYNAHLRKPENGWLKPMHMSSFLSEERAGWMDFLNMATQQESSDREIKVKAARLCLSRGSVIDMAKKWWVSIADIPSDIRAEAMS